MGRAGVAQLVERHVPNVNVEGSNPFARFFFPIQIEFHGVTFFNSPLSERNSDVAELDFDP